MAHGWWSVTYKSLLQFVRSISIRYIRCLPALMSRLFWRVELASPRPLPARLASPWGEASWGAARCTSHEARQGELEGGEARRARYGFHSPRTNLPRLVAISGRVCSRCIFFSNVDSGTTIKSNTTTNVKVPFWIQYFNLNYSKWHLNMVFLVVPLVIIVPRYKFGFIYRRRQ